MKSHPTPVAAGKPEDPKRRPRTKNAPSLPAGDLSVRERFMTVALHLFAEKGFAETSVNQIVEGAGLTKPMLYYYFESKQALFDALVDRVLTGFRGILLQPMLQNVPVKERLVRMCCRCLESTTENLTSLRLMYHLVFSHSDTGASVRKRVDPAIGDFVSVLESLVAEGIARGELAPADSHDLALAVFFVMFQTMEGALLNSPVDIGTQGMARILNNILLRPPGGEHSDTGQSEKRDGQEKGRRGTASVKGR